MPSIHLQLPDHQDAKAREIARKLNLNRSAYIRRAVEKFNVQVERELLAEQFRTASEKCREESLQVCREFDALQGGPGDSVDKRRVTRSAPSPSAPATGASPPLPRGRNARPSASSRWCAISSGRGRW